MITQITSTTVVALSMGELLAILASVGGVIGGAIAFVRKDERDKARLDQNEKDITRLTEQVSKLLQTVQELMIAIETKRTTRNSQTNVQ